MRHAHDCVVYRLIAVRVILTNHITNDTRGFFIRTIPVVVEFVHRKQDTTVYWFETIPDIREVDTHYRDYLPLFSYPVTYLHGKGAWRVRRRWWHEQ